MEDELRLINLKHLIFSVLALIDPLLSIRLNADEYGLIFIDKAVTQINECIDELISTYTNYRCDLSDLTEFKVDLLFVDNKLERIGKSLARGKALCVKDCDPYNRLESVTNSLLKCKNTLQSIISIGDERPQE